MPSYSNVKTWGAPYIQRWLAVFTGRCLVQLMSREAYRPLQFIIDEID